MGGGNGICNRSELDAAAEPLEVYAHRVILASGSEYFKGEAYIPGPNRLRHISYEGLTEGC
jgi:hypothetical protein